MKSLLTNFLILSCVICAQDSDPELYSDQKFDITNYKVDIELFNSDSINILGSAEFNFILDSDFKDPYVIFHLMELQVDSIISNSEKLNYTQVSTIDQPDYHYKVEVKANMDSFTVYYSGLATSEYPNRSWGGVHFDDNVLYSMGVGFNNNYVSTTRHWLACYDLPSDKASFDITFVTPDDIDVYSIGNKISEEFIDDGKKTTRWKTEYPTASYLVNFAISDFSKTEYEDEIETYVIHSDDQSEIVGNAFQNLAEINQILMNKFGQYPFEKIGFVLTKKGAMEHQTLINIDASRVRLYSNQDEKYGPVIIHELAHQWFGNSVSPFDFRDAWLNESFATWSEALFKEVKLGEQDYWKQIRDFGNSLFNNTTPNVEIPIYDFDRKAYSNYPYYIIYLKGAIVVSALREKIGNQVFDLAIKDHLEKYKYSNSNINDMLKSLEESSNIDLDPFFHQWIKEPGWPLIRFYTEQINAKYYLNLSQVQGEFFDLSEFDELKYYITYQTQNGEVINEPHNLAKGLNQIELNSDIDVSSLKINEYENHFALARFINVTGIEQDFSNEFDYIQEQSKIKIKSETKSNFNVSVYNTLGSELYNDKFKERIQIPIDQLRSGNYILLINDDQNHFIKKFTK